MEEEDYTTIREILADVIGKTVIEITQHDQEEFKAGNPGYIALHLSDGNTLTILMHAEIDGPILTYGAPEDEECDDIWQK